MFTRGVVVVQVAINGLNMKIKHRYYGGSTWSEWVEYALISDLESKVTNSFTASKVMTTNANGKATTSSISTSELYQLLGATTNIPNAISNINTVLGSQEILPLPSSSFAYNIFAKTPSFTDYGEINAGSSKTLLYNGATIGKSNTSALRGRYLVIALIYNSMSVNHLFIDDNETVDFVNEMYRTNDDAPSINITSTGLSFTIKNISSSLQRVTSLVFKLV